MVKGLQRLLKSRISLTKRLRQILAIGADALLVSVEGILPDAGHNTLANVVLLYIDYAVLLRYARNT